MNNPRHSFTTDRLETERKRVARLSNALFDYAERLGQSDDDFWLLKATDAAQAMWPEVDFSEALDNLKREAGVRDEGDDLVPLSKLRAMGALPVKGYE